MFRFFTASLAVALSFFLTACETVEGAGRDIEKLGENITEEAEES